MKAKFLLVSAGFALLALAARGQEQLDVGVRSTVVDGDVKRTATKTHPGEGGHGRIYGVLAVSPIIAGEKLVKPVDANRLLESLNREMIANGFIPVAKGKKPEIIITASYGRAYLRNPYTRDAGALQHAVDGTPTQEITGDVQQLFDELQPGFMANSVKASYEKLYIRITAWSFPTDQQPKPKMLWKTIMVVDDPDHRDLNAAMDKMLEAGAPYFDKEPKGPEVNIYKPLPEGHVKVGEPEVYGKTIK